MMNIPYFEHITSFKNPEFFYLLLAIPLMIVWYALYNKRRTGEIKLSASGPFANYKPTLRQRLRHLLFFLRVLAFAALVVALARPQSSLKGQNVTTEGIDIVISMDISGSMLAEDLKPNRIEASKKLAQEFVSSRPNDRIGLVVFAGESFTQCPITSDHAVLANLFQTIKSGQIADGTALGEGLATAVNRLKESKAKSKVIILMTDGVNNAGSVAPLTAAEIAEAFGIRVYTIGVGTIGTAPYPVQTPFGIRYQDVEVQIDEPTMKQIATQTDGKYFRATNNKKLKSIYAEIDKLEKTKIEVTEFKTFSEEYLPFAIAAGLLLLLEILMRYSIFKIFP